MLTCHLKKSVSKKLCQYAQPGFKNKWSVIKLPIRIHIITAYEANVPLCIESSTTYVGIVYIEHFDMTVNTLMSSLTHTHSYHKNIDKKDFEKTRFNSVIWIKYIFPVI